MDAHPGKNKRAQDLAIAYSVQRRNRKKMASGGIAEQVKREGAASAREEMPEPAIQKVGKELYLDEDERASDAEMKRDHKMHFAEGGDVEDRKQRADNEMGVHEASYNTTDKLGNNKPGESKAGATLRHVRNGSVMDTNRAMNFVKGQHKAALREQQSMKKPNLYAYGGMSILHEEMPDETEPRAGMESSIRGLENESNAERQRDYSMKMASSKRRRMAGGGMAEPEWDDAGEMGFPMLETENDPDEYSKEGIINYAMGGMTAEEEREMPEPTSQRLGGERYLDDLEYPIEGHGRGQGMREERRSLSQENPGVADSIRKKYMAMGGLASDAEDDAADDNAIEHLNETDRLNYDLGDNEMYSEMSALKDVGRAGRANPGSMGVDHWNREPSDRYDMVDEIRRKYMRDRMSES